MNTSISYPFKRHVPVPKTFVQNLLFVQYGKKDLVVKWKTYMIDELYNY